VKADHLKRFKSNKDQSSL